MTRPIKLDLVDAPAESLYAKQPKVYPREIKGRFQRLRTAAVFWLLGMFYLFPWISIGGQQLVLFDLPARQFHVFGLTFWPQDFFLLALLLMLAALTLFFFTALAGRLWCGYACPQTVWTEVFLWMERWVEGDRNKRMKLDAAPWTPRKLARKAAKQALWIGFALWTGLTFVGFFVPIRELVPAIATFEVGGWAAFWILFYAFATYGNAGFLREQVCKYMCPYARFQGAMFDRDTLIISYDAARGENRGHRRRSTPSVLERRGAAGMAADPAVAGLGDCIDCKACVQVCPTGIDIRDGLQIECIACAACIDACDDVMRRMDYPAGLIRYTTESAMAGARTRILRPRVFAYGALLLAIAGAFAWGVAGRAPLIVEVLHDRNALYREVADGGIENSYAVKLVNKTDRPMALHLSVDSALPLRVIGRPRVTLAPGEVHSLPLTLRDADGAVRGRHRIEVVAEAAAADDAEPLRIAARTHFFAPEAP
ncbi:cytochrome c oxidase accessory protein CcoG [Coralloluteibacterium thermophilus]|uniref:Cytochrome c oxidase accessory protein CcoG n=1 Tax=Coralloluteibacterium thermophilum TaxID=2707049 RepID=A0ABV9NJQ6_9GAMM